MRFAELAAASAAVTASVDHPVEGPQLPQLLAGLHARAFETPWSAGEFADLVAQPGVRALSAGEEGFILLRTVADEAEILTLAGRPESRRRGLGRALVEAGAAEAARAGALSLFLEVAHDNLAALALYARAGFAEAGRRPRYYRRPEGPAADALILVRNLALRLP